MTSTCSDPNFILVTPECRDLNIDAYNNFIAQMNNYCSIGDYSISNNTCVDYINNNQFIQSTDFNKDFKQKAADLCLDNINPDNNDNCINKYNTKPLAVKEAEIKLQEQQKIAAKIKKDRKEMIIIIIILFVFCILLGIVSTGVYFYKKRKKLSKPNLKSVIVQKKPSSS